VVQTGRRERKKAHVRQHIADVAIGLFAERGFDAVSVTEIAEAADVARPTVFAYFPRKEDLVFDRAAAVTAALVQAADASSGSPLRAVRNLLVTPGAPGGFGARVSEQLAFWRLVAGSRVLQARARELAEETEAALAEAFRDQDVSEPALCAALIAAAYRSVHLAAIRQVLSGESPQKIDAERTAQLARALDAVEQAVTRLATTASPEGN
jgi:AcrR family transcriptional regulator